MSIFKESFNEEIVKTLSIRQELMGKNNRTPQELSFLNSNTSWASLKSAIDVNDDKGNLAKNNVLEGGSLINGKLRYGVNPTGSYSFQNSLGENNELGIRPMPGITSVTIENIGAYGSTRRATINYQCWDVKQLDIFEQLYMRPGYLVLLEFGRSSYLEKDSNGISKLKQNTPQYDFFAQQNINLLDELKKLYNKSIESKGNYDAFLGYVVNYGWQIRPDGGYDCKTEIISTGEVLESLKTNYSLATNVDFLNIETGNSKFRGLLFPSFPNTKINTDDLKRLNEDYSSNVLLGLIREVYLLGYYDQANKLLPAPTDPGVFSINVNGKPDPVTNKPKSINLFLARSQYASTNDKQYKLTSLNNFNCYITLESFLELLNEFVIPHAQDSEGKDLGVLTKLSVYDREYLNKGGESLKCLYNILMTSVDPDVCLIRNDIWSDILQNIDITVNIDPIHIIPKGYELTLGSGEANLLRVKMIDWITRLSKNEVSAVDHITKNIHEVDYKNWKGRNPGKPDAEYFKYFQQVYQTVRGGLNPESKIQSSRTIVTQGGESTTIDEEKSILPIRSWNYLRSYPNLVKTLRKEFNAEQKKDLKFINLVRGRYPGVLTPEQKFILEGLSNTSNDAILDTALDQFQSTANKGIQAAKKVEETKKSINEVGNNYKRFLHNIPKSFVAGTEMSKQPIVAETEMGKRKFGEIKNIYLNLKYLYSLTNDPNLKTQDPQGKNSLLLSQLITTMLKDVQASIGNVNDFELHIDDKDGVGRIIDLNYISREGTPFQFEIGSNKSIIRDLKLESKIFSDQVSMIAISAQGDSGRLGLDNSTLVAFNKGITDRLIPKKDSPSVISQNDKAETLIASLSSLTSQFFSPYMLNYWSKDGGKFTSENSTSFKDYLRDIIVFFTDKYNTDNKKSMLLPSLISFTMDGIAGLVIGNLFTIDKTFIPKSYKEEDKEVGYIIVKVGHQIQNNDWTTNIEGIQNIPEKNPKPITNPTQFSLVVTYEPLTGNIITGTIVADGVISSSTTDFNTICKSIINNLEGGYYHPDMLKDGRIKDSRFDTSGETMFGIDRKNSASDIGVSSQGKEFWNLIDQQNARKNWKHLYIPPDDPLKTKLLDLACAAIKTRYDAWSVRYFTNKTLLGLVNSNGKLKFNFIYACWNGEGFFKKWASDAESAYQQGITNADQLAILITQKRVNSSLSLIKQGGDKISKLLGISIS
jgi:hypothetical protein